MSRQPKKHYLHWEFDASSGEWRAKSAIECPGYVLEWVIAVCDDGSFDISQSDLELIGRRPVPTFATLAEAKASCQETESYNLAANWWCSNN